MLLSHQFEKIGYTQFGIYIKGYKETCSLDECVKSHPFWVKRSPSQPEMELCVA